MNWLADGWVQALVQGGALTLALFVVRGMLASHQETVRDLMGAFGSAVRDQREHDGKKTDQLVGAVQKVEKSITDQTLSFRLDVQSLHNAVALACKAQHLPAETAGAEKKG